jgi:hypothetical protein
MRISRTIFIFWAYKSVLDRCGTISHTQPSRLNSQRKCSIKSCNHIKHTIVNLGVSVQCFDLCGFVSVSMGLNSFQSFEYVEIMLLLDQLSDYTKTLCPKPNGLAINPMSWALSHFILRIKAKYLKP